jgi:HEAT repeat protein
MASHPVPLQAEEPAPGSARSKQIAVALADLREGSPFAVLAAQDLGAMGAREAAGELVRWATGTQGGEKLIRIAALGALGRIGGDEARRALEPLEQVVADESAGDVRLYAARALAEAGDADSLGALRQARLWAPNMLTEDAIDAAIQAILERTVI